MINEIPAAASSSMTLAKPRMTRADLCALPVAGIYNSPLNLSQPQQKHAAEDEPFFDALDIQPWMTPASAQWPLLSSLASQVKEAIHYQLHLLSQTTLASNLLNVIHPDLSKLLAAVLICSRERQDILWQAGLTGGLELIHRLIYLAAGATSTAAMLSTLPGLLIIWLQRHHISLTEGVLHTLTTLLASGLQICAHHDFAQPEWLVALHHQAIAPIGQLCSDTGVTEVVTTGITLILALYTMLRISGWSGGKRPVANVFIHGVKIIQDICKLSGESHDLQRLYEVKNRQVLTKTWYEATHHKPWEESKGTKALNRAVIRCMPKKVLLQKDRPLSDAAYLPADNPQTEKFYQAYHQTEQQILSRQLTHCPQDQRPMLPRWYQDGVANDATTPPLAMPSSANPSAPLLVTGTSAVIAATAAQNSGWNIRTNLLLAASGITLLAGARYLHNSLSDITVASEPSKNALSDTINLCTEGTNKIRSLINSDKTGAPLAIEFFDYLFDEQGDINSDRADRLLAKFNITTFRSTDRLEMNEQILHLLSLLLLPAEKKEPVDINSLIIAMGNKINAIWIYFINNKKNSSAKVILNELRLHCSKGYLSMGIYGRLDMHKITDFLISYVAPDLLFLERNGRGNENLLSKNVYYIWNYIGKRFSENKYIRNNEFETALSEGKVDGFVIARLRSYATYNLTEDREYLEDTYKDLNKDMYAYHKSDVELEGIPIVTFDDIIKNAFPDIDIEAPQDFNTLNFRIITQGRVDANIRILAECKSFRDLIRNFDDGFRVLYNFLPRKIPQSLRDYSSGNKKTFSLKKHPTLSELYSKFDQAYQQMVDYHCKIYSETVDKACEISSDAEYNFLNSTNTIIYAIDAKVNRFKKLRYTLQSIFIKINHRVIERASYNTRPYHEIGKFFFGYNHRTKEKRYYFLDIETSRVHPRHFPLQRLSVEQTEEIFKPENRLLNENYIFMDQQSFFDPCDEIKEPKTSLLSHTNEAGKFFREHYEYYKNKLCNTLRNEKDILVSFRERRLVDNNGQALETLKKEVTENRRKLLYHLKHQAHNPTEVERLKAKGKAQQLIESFPYYNCFELFRDLLYTREDVTPPSALIPGFQITLCMADLYMGYGFKKTLTTLMKSLRKIYTYNWMRRSELSLLNLKMNKALANSASESYRKTLDENIKITESTLKSYEDEIADLRFQIQGAVTNIVSMPVFIAFPCLSLRTGKDFLHANVPWGINVAKKYIKEAYARKKTAKIHFAWSNPLAVKSVENEKYILPQPGKSNFTCNSNPLQPDNIILDVFEFSHINPTLYQKLFFTALRNPDVESVIAEADNAGWDIPEEYNQMSMFCFISLTIPVRWYTSAILTLQKYYKKETHDIKITEEALYQYYFDNHSRPYISPPVTLEADQNIFLNQSIKTIKDLFVSNVKAVELNYLFMIQYLLMREEPATLLQIIEGDSLTRQKKLDHIQQNLSYNMDKFTIYGSSHSSAQLNFHTSVVQQFFEFCQQLIDTNPANITLLSPDIETFQQRLEQFRQQHPDAILPSLTSFTTNWQQLAQRILDTYQPLVRIEYSAQVLADFPVSQWSEENALDTWFNALQDYLFPEMHYEILTPVLRQAAEDLSQRWQKRLTTADIPIGIINNDVVNPLFLEDVRQALKKSCASYPRLYFCRVYQKDNGHWFTFLINDFMSDNYHRSRRQLHTATTSWPVSPQVSPLLSESALLSEAPLLARFTSEENVENIQRYQQRLSSILNTFLRFKSLPFHQRLQENALDSRPQVNRTARQDIMTLINEVIDTKGNIIDYQYRVLSHYLPMLDVPDNYLILQLLSDIFHLATPELPELYGSIFQHLQNKFADPNFSLASLAQANFIDEQITEFNRRVLSTLSNSDSTTQQAIRRYITATIRHLLSFSSYLTNIEPLLAMTPLSTLSSQWLCLGAIITRQLKLEAATTGELLRLGYAAQQDTGLLSLGETAIQQMAFLSGSQPITDRRDEASDALKTLSSNVFMAAEMQQRVFSCLEASQWLTTVLAQTAFTSPIEVDQLRTLLGTALQEQRKLLQNALLQLSDKKNLQLTRAVYQGELHVSWYREEKNPTENGLIVGLALHIKNQPGILLPLGDPESVPPLFRQLTSRPDQHELTHLCFSDSDGNHTLTDTVRITLAVGTQSAGFPVTNPAIVLFEWMQSEADKRFEKLVQAKTDAAFLAAKEALVAWLSQHLFFYQRDNHFYYSLPQQTEQLKKIIAHPDIARWQHRDTGGLIGTNAVSRFSHAISAVMGASTIWPSLTTVLRTAAPRTGGNTFAEVPENGFVGFWWDPVSQFCYLGWKTAGQRTLYASVASNRDTLFPLTDDAASAAIWPILTRFDWLQQDIQALRIGAISTHKLFHHSIPLAWQLQCAMTAAIPLPAGSRPKYHDLAEVYTHTRGNLQKSYFSPSGTGLATPVTVSELSGGGYRLDFSPHTATALQDHYLAIETNQINIAHESQWRMIGQQAWQLLPDADAGKLAEQGILAPSRYLQWGNSNNHTTTMIPTSRVLQRSDGCMVFVFTESDQRISYRMLDPEGQLQTSPVLPTDWPRAIATASARQLDTAITQLIAQQKTPDYRALLEPDEQQRLETALSDSQQRRPAAIIQASSRFNALPFRFEINKQALSELDDAILTFRMNGQHFYLLVKKFAQLEDSNITLDELLWNPVDWRDNNLFIHVECDRVLEKVEQKKKLLLSMRNRINAFHQIRYTCDNLKLWINQDIDLLTRAAAAIEFIKAQPQGESIATDTLLPLQLQRFAQNYFFSYYEQQPHVTAEVFQQPWQCLRDESGLVQSDKGWQQALDQLHTLVTALPPQVRVLDRLLSLPEPLWQAAEMQQRAQQWQQISQQAFRYWQTPRRSEQIVLLRPKVSTQDRVLMSHQYRWPVRLILAAGTGDPTHNQTEGIAPPLRVGVEQNEDLLLTQPGPAKAQQPETRLAGINADPRNAKEFAAWSKLRLSSPWALESFSGPAFFLRLQNRIQQVMAQEQHNWSQQERDFYTSPLTAAFVQESQPERIDKRHYAPLFIQLFNNQVLVTRLVMTDAEMLFGLLCDHFAQKYPERATEDLSKAWFLFLHTFENQNDDNSYPPLYLIGV